ncbi:MAG: long-chain acyl-CoA synthetase [Actinomycetota bacterium]|nr:long-chain acyl-CoA synthetase [Actinomycetota bacterium]
MPDPATHDTGDVPGPGASQASGSSGTDRQKVLPESAGTSPFTGRPWLSSYAPDVPAEVDIPAESLPQMLAGSAATHGSRTALVFQGACTSYTELAERVEKAAQALWDLGVRPGDRVGLVLPNCPQHVVAFYAVLRLGGVVVEHNPLYTAGELLEQFADHEARFAICWDKATWTLEEIRASTQLQTILSVDLTRALPWPQRLALKLPLPPVRKQRAEITGPVPEGVRDFDGLVDAAAGLDPEHPGPTPQDVALLQYTGGTTGTPKGAVLTHRNLRANAAQGAAWLPGLKDGEETFYGVLPLFHAYGLTLCLSFAMSVGATLVLFPRFDLKQMLATMRRRPATFLPAVPPVYERLAAAAHEQRIDLTSIRYGLSGAVALPPEIVTEWERVSGGLLVEGYGMTETSPVCLGNPVAPTRRPGTVGVPFPSTDIRIVDPDHPEVDLPLGEAGELLVRGPQVFSGYWNQPAETAKVFVDGWLRTGDIVVADAAGFVKVVDRIKELVITGGFNVYPTEVEEVLRHLPEVKDACVVGLPTQALKALGASRPGSGKSGEYVVAVVLPAPGAQIDIESIRSHVRTRLAAYKVPRHVVVADELPRSQVGKVLRRQVRDRLLRETGTDR